VLPDFSLRNIPKTGGNVQNNHKIFKMATKYTKWQLNRPKGHKIYQHLPLQDPPKFTQIGIFGLKIWHLATLFLDE
jgi:predicted secreted protein